MPTILTRRRPRRPGPGRRRGPAAASTASASSARSRTRRTPELAPDAVLRDDGLALHLPRGMEGHDRTTSAPASSTRRSSPSGSRDFDEDRWELFDLSRGLLRVDRPRRRRAGAATAACATCGTPRRAATTSCPSPTGSSTASGASSPRRGRPGTQRTFRPGGGPVADESVPLLWGGFDITADIDTDRDGAGGVVFALGDWFGGYALYLVGGQGPLHVRPGRRHARADDGGRPRPRAATTSPSPTSSARATAWAAWSCPSTGRRSTRRRWRGCCPLAVQHGGAGLRLGWDSGFPVSSRYAPPAPLRGHGPRRPRGHAGFACGPIRPTRSAPRCTPTDGAARWPQPPVRGRGTGVRQVLAGMAGRHRRQVGRRKHQAAGRPEGGPAVELVVAARPELALRARRHSRSRSATVSVGVADPARSACAALAWSIIVRGLGDPLASGHRGHPAPAAVRSDSAM